MRLPLTAVLFLALLASPPAAHAEEPHDALCRSLTGSRANVTGLEHALADGASPNDPCAVTERDMKLRFEGLLLILATGGAAYILPGWLGSQAWESVEKTYPVPPLVLASERHSEAAVRTLLDSGGDLATLQGAFGQAVARGSVSWAEFLAEVGAERRVEELHAAVLQPEVLERLLATEPDLQGAYIEWDECHLILKAHPEMLPALLNAGMRPSAMNGAVHSAVMREDLDWTATLIEHGADRSLNKIPLGILGDTEAMERLVALQLDLEHLIILHTQLRYALPRNPAMLDQLERLGSDPVELALDAVQYHHLDLLEPLVEGGLDINRRAVDGGGKSPLDLAVKRSDRAALDVLVELGAEVGPDRPDHAIREAARWKDADLLVMLIEQATPPDQRQRWWVRATEIAATCERPAIVEATLAEGRAAGVDDLVEPVIAAVNNNDAEMVALLLAGSRNPVRAASEGLQVAAERGMPDIAAQLLALGADPNRPLREHGNLPLHIAVTGYHYAEIETVRALVEGGADPDARDAAGRSALHRCADEDKGDTAAELLRLGASADPLDQEGVAPLEHAVRARAWAAVAAMVSGGATAERWMVEAALDEPWHPESLSSAVVAMAASDLDAPPSFWKRQLRKARRAGRAHSILEALEQAAEPTR